MFYTIDSIKQFFAERGYRMEQAMGGHYYCVRDKGDGTDELVWSDSACVDAYDIDSALVVAYNIIQEETWKARGYK